MKICIVTGGSGGHIYPALTFADYAKENSDTSIFFIGNQDRMESRIIPEAGYPFFAIHNKGLQGSVLDKVKAVAGQFSAISEARKILKEQKPDLLFAFGGYVTLPCVLAAHRLNIPVVLHEQNAYVGKANKMAARYARAIITCYDKAFEGVESVYQYGNPRGAIDPKQIDSKHEMKRLGIKDTDAIVLYVMGSQGAQTMNDVMVDLIPKVKDKPYKLVVSTGANEYQSFIRRIEQVPSNVIVEPFVDQKALLGVTDLVVARSGATTIAELAAFKTPSILIPSPYVANNHQLYNAKALEDKGACVLIEEDRVKTDVLMDAIDDLMGDSIKLKAIGTAVSTFARPDANQRILALLKTIGA
ncbi:hypothetical protein AOC36_04790 [Erysipelothrix larvae]|uniref:UDP-N-acetylglucosamine--N-acetylmuramyl-(pentapeptide) pyrophosphoryl-undecaprenol N-acetylglucosamine transferase n=1 Tax=Erysipelothrix larvae TaxID=1514105 RepID=A0A0X8GZW9_9FIRM|nr:undecaprenyldiphospho-muramoylpentapeptide beta-N-acetylglucosaminyltransferase [Erysipelothrix larvae]AMC93314.1 hypothetical protein AOC36_04790 [Erysipelothrix larvae]